MSERVVAGAILDVRSDRAGGCSNKPARRVCQVDDRENLFFRPLLAYCYLLPLMPSVLASCHGRGYVREGGLFGNWALARSDTGRSFFFLCPRV